MCIQDIDCAISAGFQLVQCDSVWLIHFLFDVISVNQGDSVQVIWYDMTPLDLLWFV